MTAHIKDFIEQEFYHFHSHPELSYQEFETTKRLKEDLEKNGIKILPLDFKNRRCSRNWSRRHYRCYKS